MHNPPLIWLLLEWLPNHMVKMFAVTKLPDITEEVICTIHILVLLLQVGYQMVTKLYRENV